MKTINRTYLTLTLILVMGVFLRFYKLDWGQGLFTHPDEYHIVISVNQLSFPTQMHPHFFSYGTVIIYLIYFTKLLLSAISSQLSAINPFLIGRFYSALFSTLTIPLIYLITLNIASRKFALLAAFLAATTAGLIQQAHFSTPESALIFFLLGSLLFLIQFVQHKKLTKLLLSSVFLGLALGVKVSSIFFAPTILLAIMAVSLPKNIKKIPLLSALSMGTIILTLLIIAPFIFLDFPAFKNNIEYEGNLAAGNLAAFYTRQFINTTPVLFQLEKILPYTLGPSLLILGIIGFSVIVFNIYKKQNIIPIILTTSFLSLFLPNAFLLAKWTRFLAPTFPFFAIFASYLLFKLSQVKVYRSLFIILYSLFIILNLLWSLAFFSIYLRDDVRITASSWIEQNIPTNTTFLVEGGNMVDLPLEGNYQKISLDFYNLEESSLDQQKIADALEEADYFLIQSRRVFVNHQRLPEQFPKTATFYNKLFSGDLGFKQVKEFSSFPSLEIGNWKLEIPDEAGEETWSVFDHPVIRIYEKRKQLTEEEYGKLFR